MKAKNTLNINKYYYKQVWRIAKQLANIWPYKAFDISVWINCTPRTWVPVTAYKKGELLPLFTQWPIYRSILPNELVIDLDPKDPNDWGIVRYVGSKIAKTLEKQKIPYNLWFSGHKGLHFHIFIDHKIIEDTLDVFEKIAKVEHGQINEDTLENTVNKYVNGIITYILPPYLRTLEIIDSCTFTSQKHLIKFEGAKAMKRHEKGFVFHGYKSHLTEIPSKKPKILLSNKVCFPKELVTWSLPTKKFEALILEVYKFQKLKQEKLKKLGKVINKKIDKEKLAKILEELQNCVFSDYRKQIYWLFIAPTEVLLNLEKIEKEGIETFAEEVANKWNEWFKQNYKVAPTNGHKLYQSWLKSVVKWIYNEKIKNGKTFDPCIGIVRKAVKEGHLLEGFISL